MGMKLPPDLEAKVLAMSRPARREAARVDEIELPVPPSANHIWRVAGKRNVKSRVYADWLDESVPFLRHHFRRFDGPVEIYLTVVGIPTNSDLDNRIKPTVDALVQAGVIPTDNCSVVKRVCADYEPLLESGREPYVRVKVVERK